MFSPGETVIQRFVLPLLPSEIKYVIVSYKKDNNIILEKKISNGFTNNNASSSVFTISLTQEESLLFGDRGYYTLQLNVYTTNFGRMTSKEIRSENGAQYLKEVMNSV